MAQNSNLPAQNITIESSSVSIKNMNVPILEFLPAPYPIEFQQGGPQTSPKDTPLVLAYPRNPIEPPVGLVLTSSFFNSTWDPIMLLGWNTLFEDPSQPRVLFGIEYRYEQPAGTFNSEFYWEIQYTGQNPIRPFFANVDRATLSTSPSAMLGTGANDSFQVVDQAGSPFFLAGRPGIIFPKSTIPFEVTASVVEINSNNIQLLTASGGNPYTAGDWATASPTTIVEAVNRMSALLKTLNGGVPIP